MEPRFAQPVPFVGRANELGLFARLGGRDSGPAAAVVVGEPGVGKSRLLAEAVSRVDLPRVALAGYEPASEIPLGAAGELLRELALVPGPGARFDDLLYGYAPAAGGLQTMRIWKVSVIGDAAGERKRLARRSTGLAYSSLGKHVPRLLGELRRLGGHS